MGEGGGPVLDRQVGEVDIDREARHVAHEEVDRGAALECEAGLLGDERNDADQQRGLPAEFLRCRHRGSLGP